MKGKAENVRDFGGVHNPSKHFFFQFPQNRGIRKDSIKFNNCNFFFYPCQFIIITNTCPYT